MFAKISIIGIWPILRPWACIYVCIYFVIIRPPPKEGRTATLCSRLILYLSFLSSAGLALLENFSSEQTETPSPRRCYAIGWAETRSHAHSCINMQWGRGMPLILSVLRARWSGRSSSGWTGMCVICVICNLVFAFERALLLFYCVFHRFNMFT